MLSARAPRIWRRTVPAIPAERVWARRPTSGDARVHMRRAYPPHRTGRTAPKVWKAIEMRFTYAETMTDPTFYVPLAQAAEAAEYTSMTIADSVAYPKESDATYP